MSKSTGNSSFRLWSGILFLFVCTAASLYAQGKPPAEKLVSLNVKNETLKSIFDKITQQTSLYFTGAADQLDRNFRTSITVTNEPLNSVLAKLLKGKGVSWLIGEKTITIVKGEKTTITSSTSYFSTNADTASNNITVNGKVTDDKGNPIPGATVMVKGGKRGVTTAVDGTFQLTNVDKNTILNISSIGYLTIVISASNKSLVEVKLKNYVGALDETVIIGYGTTTKRFNTGDVTTVKSTDIEKQPVSNLLLALQGRVPGMIITQTTGVPGGAIDVQIRGMNSIVNGNNPLYIIDGVPFGSTSLASIGSTITGNVSPLNFINPLDILSIDILKDADATAIYGSRGANGVVLITTKKGVAGSNHVDFNFNKGVGMVTRTADMLNTRQYLDMRYEALKNDGIPLASSTSNDLKKWDTTRYTDWQKSIIEGSAQYTDAQLSMSGGTNNLQYLIGTGYRKETTVFSKDFNNSRGSVHLNINSSNNNKKLKVTLSATYLIDNNNLIAADLMDRIVLPPDAPSIYNNDGSINWAGSTWDNPQARFFNKYKVSTNNLVSNGIVGYTIFPGLEIKASAGYTNTQLNESSGTAIASFRPSRNVTTGSTRFTTNNTWSWIVEPQILYEKRIGKSNFNALIGSTLQENLLNKQTIQGDGYTNDALLANLTAANTISKGDITYIQYKYNAIYGRINYNLSEKYLVNITARRDGSSRFGPGKKFGNFAAIGIGWIFSNEELINNSIPLLSFGKFRASYGTTGNDQIQDYQYLELYTFATGSVPYQGGQGLIPSYLPASDYSWELNKKLEAALDLGFYKDKFLLSINYYRNRSSNQLVGYQLADITGFQSITANFPATVENRGWEFSGTLTNIKKKAFTWSSNFNLTIARNKLIEFKDIENSSYRYSYSIGKPIGILRAFHMIGVDPATGVYSFQDSKGIITSSPDYTNDRTVFINTNPKFYGGIQNNFQYKGFQLDFLFQFVKQTGKNYLFSFIAPGRSGFNQPTAVLDRWQKPGDISSIQKFTQNSGSDAAKAYSFAGMSDYIYSDASFIRLKNLSISYSLKEEWGKILHLQSCRIYIQCQNLLTFTRYKGVDPENQSITALPPLKVITIGTQISL